MANLVSGLVFFAVVAPVSWPVVALIAVGSVLGGLVGARVGRRLSPKVLRVVVVLVGVAAFVNSCADARSIAPPRVGAFAAASGTFAAASESAPLPPRVGTFAVATRHLRCPVLTQPIGCHM